MVDHRAEIMRSLELNVGDTLCDSALGNDFLVIKAIKGKLDITEIKSYC